MDDINIIPQGIIGYTLKTMPYYNCEYEDKPLQQWLDDVLFNDTFLSYDYEPPAEPEDFVTVHQRNDIIIQPFNRQIGSKQYYDTRNIYLYRKHDLLLKTMHYTIGVKATNSLLRIQKNRS